MSKIKVCKFGGKSLATSAGIDLAARIMLDDEQRRLCVVSAPGARFESDPKITKLLKDLAQFKNQKCVEAFQLINLIAERYDKIFPGSLYEITKRLKVEFNKNLPDPYYYANLVSAGERLQAFCFAEKTGFELINPLQYLVGVGNPLNAHILPETYERLATFWMERERNRKGVMAGYQCLSKDGLVMILDNGGSDKTGSILARGVKAEIYENFTDSAVLAVSPQYVDAPEKIPEMTRKELRDLSYSGFDLFQQSALQPLEGTTIKLHIRGTEQYPQEGTMVTIERIADNCRPVLGIACKEKFCSFSVEAAGINDEVGVLCDILRIFKDKKIPVEIPPSGIDDISVIVHQDDLQGDVDQFKEAISELVYDYQTGRIYGEEFVPDPCIKKSDVEFRDNLACVIVAGKGLRDHPLVYADIDATLAQNRIPVYGRSTGMKKRSFIYALNSHDAKKAVNVLYERFVKKS